MQNLEGFWYLDPPRKDISQLRLNPRHSLAVAWNILVFMGKGLPGCDAFGFALQLRDVACARPHLSSSTATAFIAYQLWSCGTEYRGISFRQIYRHLDSFFLISKCQGGFRNHSRKGPGSSLLTTSLWLLPSKTQGEWYFLLKIWLYRHNPGTGIENWRCVDNCASAHGGFEVCSFFDKCQTCDSGELCVWNFVGNVATDANWCKHSIYRWGIFSGKSRAWNCPQMFDRRSSSPVVA